MSTVSSSDRAADAKFPRTRRPWCTPCATNRYLALESVQTMHSPAARLVDVAYTCTACLHFYSHPVTAAQAGLLMECFSRGVEILQIGGVYFHCGEPLPTVAYGQCSIRLSGSTENSSEKEQQALSLGTKLLRCGCGFQMEIPD